MKYDEQFYNLSAEAYNMINTFDNSRDEEIERKQNKLLEILLTKFKEQLELRKQNGEGVLKVRFNSKFYQDPELGYNEIDELVKSNNFDSFASEYCIYIGDIEHRCNEHYTAYYEIIWDYKAYYEKLKDNKDSKVL